MDIKERTTKHRIITDSDNGSNNKQKENSTDGKNIQYKRAKYAIKISYPDNL